MKSRTILLAMLLLAIFAWPPVYDLCFATPLQDWLTGHGKMKDYEIQKLLAAQRWVIDIPTARESTTFGTELNLYEDRRQQDRLRFA